MGDRVVVLRRGVLQQVAEPQQLYERPANLFVAEFIGSPAMNLVEATLDRAGDQVVARFGTHELTLSGPSAAGAARHGGSQVILGFRPEDLADATLTGGASPGARLTVVPEIREDMGAEVLIHFGLGVPPVRRRDVIEGAEPEDPAGAELGARSAIPFVARLARGTNAKEGEQLELAVDTTRLHVFDPVTGEALGAAGA
jgi:multiple sugar transport system ATP-binding protein